MGKVLSTFDLGWPGAISRAVDDIVISVKNADTDPIPFGSPVFLKDDGSGVVNFITGGSQTFERFVGFAVRSADKTPDTYPAGQDMQTLSADQAGAWNPGEVIEVLVRGTVSVRGLAGFDPGSKVYIRKFDGALVANPGSEGTTLWLENVRIRQPQTGNGPCSEMVVLSRNIQ